MKDYNIVSKNVPVPATMCIKNKPMPNSSQLGIMSSNANALIQAVSPTPKHLNACLSSFLNQKIPEELYHRVNQLFQLCCNIFFFLNFPSSFILIRSIYGMPLWVGNNTVK